MFSQFCVLLTLLLRKINTWLTWVSSCNSSQLTLWWKCDKLWLFQHIWRELLQARELNRYDQKHGHCEKSLHFCNILICTHTTYLSSDTLITPSSLGMTTAVVTTSWKPSILLSRHGFRACGWVSAAMSCRWTNPPSRKQNPSGLWRYRVASKLLHVADRGSNAPYCKLRQDAPSWHNNNTQRLKHTTSCHENKTSAFTLLL